MAFKRPVVLMTILLILLGYAAMPRLSDAYHSLKAGEAAPAAELPALPGANSISNLAVTQQADGQWVANFDYFFTGAPKHAMVEVYQVVTGTTDSTPRAHLSAGATVQRGARHLSLMLPNPRNWEMALTTSVYAVLVNVTVPQRTQLARMDIDQRIRWPDPVVAEVEKALAANQPETIVQQAVELIDRGEQATLQKARALLQALIERRPRTDSAYVELARVAMKTNWNPAGLRDAETLIRSALQISPESANAKILLGYVLAHQGRYKEAEPLFVQAAASNPPNLWLWANWGELLAMQGKVDAAIGKYREAVRRPPTGDTYDRARQDAFGELLRLVGERKDLDGLEALHIQRTRDYPGTRCFSVEYARFLVLQRADAAQAVAVLRDKPSPNCDAARTRELQGLAHYVTWSRADSAARAESLLQARAFLPPSPALYYAFASSERTEAIAKQLIAAGDPVDAQDNRGYSALGYALRASDRATAVRLLRLGAKPMAEQGAERMPAALIPVFSRDFEGIRLLQRAGVDYTKLRYQGMTAVDYARSREDSKLLLAVDPQAGGL